MSTPENDFQWQHGTLASARISEGIGTMGTFFRRIGHLMGRRNLSTFEVTEYETDRKYGFKSLSGLLHSKTFYTLESVGDGTRIQISIEARTPIFFELNEATLGITMKTQLKEDITELKNILEAHGTGNG
jgi:hypothetical protein